MSELRKRKTKTRITLENDPQIIYSVKIDDKRPAVCWKYFGIALKNGEIFDDKHLYCSLCFPAKLEPR